jgi:diaminopimelate epimerase
VGARAKGPGKVDVQTLGGRLQVEFTKVSEQDFEDIWLCGPATFVFKGEIELQ